MVIIPRKNEKDLRDIPEEIRKQLKIVLVDSMEQVLEAALRRKPKPLKVGRRRSSRAATSCASRSRSAGSAARRSRPPEQPPVVVAELTITMGRTERDRAAVPSVADRA